MLLSTPGPSARNALVMCGTDIASPPVRMLFSPFRRSSCSSTNRLKSPVVMNMVFTPLRSIASVMSRMLGLACWRSTSLPPFNSAP